MKTRFFLTSALFMLSMASQAQIQLLYMENNGRNVIDRTKKLYWMEGDDDPCYDISNYKKTGNKETFNLCEKDQSAGVHKLSVAITLDGKGLPTQMTINDLTYKTKQTYNVETTSGSASEDARLKEYFSRLAGYPESEVKKYADSGAAASAAGTAQSPAASAQVPTSKEDLQDSVEKGAAGKVKDAANKAFGKVKGLFKKKK